MSLSRDQLSSLLTGAATVLANSHNRFEQWDNLTEPLRASALDADREWLTDRLNDLAHSLGLPAERAEVQRLLDSKGLAHHGDEEPKPGPYPYYRLFRVGAAREGVNVLEALRQLQPGGDGEMTWGAQAEGAWLWIAHARPGATAMDIQDRMDPIRSELAVLGLQFADEVFTKFYVQPSDL